MRGQSKEKSRPPKRTPISGPWMGMREKKAPKRAAFPKNKA